MANVATARIDATKSDRRFKSDAHQAAKLLNVEIDGYVHKTTAIYGADQDHAEIFSLKNGSYLVISANKYCFAAATFENFDWDQDFYNEERHHNNIRAAANINHNI